MVNAEPNAKKTEYDSKRRAKDAERDARARRKKFRSFAIWGGGAVALLGAIGMLAFSVKNGGGTGSRTALLLDAVADADHKLGNVSNKNIFLEYGDYQCPACSLYHPVVKKAVEESGANITFVYRHFPLRNIHANADLAARAAEASGGQGKFWEMHDMLYVSQNEWKDLRASQARETFVRYGAALGLDLARFEAALDAPETKAKVDADLASGLKAGVKGTPAFYLNGKYVDPRASLDDFRSLLAGEPTSFQP